MFEIGVGVLSQAQRNLFYWDATKIDEGVFGVLQAAHACELIMKATIADEHPLFIFSNVPKSTNADEDLLEFKDLFENGRTIRYSELPEKLLAVKGYKISEHDTYETFGKLRNCIQHFSVPNVDLSQEGIEFIWVQIF